jgi:BirA family biotin operon repressor/biotin-[acetyl-CoA-carboxylase] ligase
MEDILSDISIKRALNTRVIGRRILYLPVVPSTMLAVKEEAIAGAIEGTVVIAGRQTMGKGRLYRTWLSPPGSLALSILLYPGLDLTASLTVMAAVAAARSITAITGLEARFKWPNDVLVNGKKVAGILADSGARGDTSYAVIGIGVNVNNPVADLGALAWPATNLSREGGKSVNRLALLVKLLTELDGLYVSGDTKAIYRE